MGKCCVLASLNSRSPVGPACGTSKVTQRVFSSSLTLGLLKSGWPRGVSWVARQAPAAVEQE